MNGSIVISTANNRTAGLSLKPLWVDGRYVLIHQVFDTCVADQKPEFLFGPNVDYFRLDYPGLTKSRNFGLDCVESGYAHIMDDDVDVNVDEVFDVMRWMKENSVDVATCQFSFESGALAKPYRKEPFKHSILSVAKVSSIEICVNVESLRKKGIRFDERFGLGSNYPSGEEYIFLTDCIKAGLNVWFFPRVIGVHPNITSGMDFYTTSSKVLAKREMLIRVFGRKSFFYIFAFWLKRLPVVFKSGYFFSFTRLMFFGR